MEMASAFGSKFRPKIGYHTMSGWQLATNRKCQPCSRSSSSSSRPPKKEAQFAFLSQRNFSFSSNLHFYWAHSLLIHISPQSKIKFKKFSITMKLALLSLLLLLAFCAATLAATNGNPGNNGSAATTTPASAQRPPSQVNPAGFNNNENNNNNSASSAMAAPQQQQSVQFQSGGDNCPPLLGNNFPSRQTLTAQGGQSSQSCQWIIISNQQNCPQFFQNCGSNQQMCRSQNEIWWQCTSDCEPSCGNPSPSCRRRCGRSGCQCFPGFLRNQGGFCVPSSQCPSADCSDDNDCPGQSVCVNSQCQQPDCSNDNDCPGNQICENNQCQESGCSNDNDCPGSSSICVNRQCRQGCTSDNACAIDAQCSNGRCVERRQCQQDRQCRGQKICFNRQCRLVGSISCRSNFDCPRSAFCGRNGRCFFPNTRAIEDGFDF